MSVCVLAVFILSACGGSPLGPGIAGRVHVVATIVAKAGDPPAGAIASLRVDVRDESGASLGNPVIVPVSATDLAFDFEVDASAGQGRIITVLAIGERPVTGGLDGPDTGIGVLYRGSISGIDVRARANESQALALESFVPALQPVEIVPAGVRVQWTAEPGADLYSLTRFYDGIGLITTNVLGTSFIDDTGASRYQVVAVERSGRRSAPSDILVGHP